MLCGRIGTKYLDNFWYQICYSYVSKNNLSKRKFVPLKIHSLPVKIESLNQKTDVKYIK